jgi:putative transposase
MVTPAARREVVARLRESREVSERRACTMIAADRGVVRYRSRRPDDAALRGRLRELADQRRRFGYRRLHVLLRGEGWSVNRKKTQRLYREEGLPVRRCDGLTAGSPWRAPRSRRPQARTAAGRRTSCTTNWRTAAASGC